MQNLLFLGEIPFTNIYVSFWQWLGFITLGLPLAIWLYRRRHALLAWGLGVYVAWLVRHYHLEYRI